MASCNNIYWTISICLLLLHNNCITGNDVNKGGSIQQSTSTTCLPYWLGDGFCDLGCNTKEYNYDDGDCCYKTCIAKVRRFPCGYTGFQCRTDSGDIPSWFLKIKLCFRWKSTGAAAQCDNTTRGLICAPVGSMTRFYLDDTDKRRGGCRLSWKIEARDVPVSFKNNMMICFGSYADGDYHQCNNGITNTQQCQPLNKWLNYLDDTDDREGGCYMTWKLQYSSGE